MLNRLKHITLFFLLCFIFSCNIDHNPAHINITKFIEEKKPGLRSYEAISWGKPDSLFNDFASTEEYEGLKQSYENLNEQEAQMKRRIKALNADKSNPNYKKKIKPLKKEYRQLLDSSRMLMENILRKQGVFRKVYSGWVIDHTYKADFGENKIQTFNETFLLDTNWNVKSFFPTYIQ